MFKFIQVLLLVMFSIPLALSQGDDIIPESSNTRSNLPQACCEKIAKSVFISLVSSLGENNDTKEILKFSKKYAQNFSGDINADLNHNAIKREFETEVLEVKKERRYRDYPAKVTRKDRNRISAKKSRDRRKNLHSKIIEEIYELINNNSYIENKNNDLEKKNEYLQQQNEVLQQRNELLQQQNELLQQQQNEYLQQKYGFPQNLNEILQNGNTFL